MNKRDYILNPTKASSLSYWKTNRIKVPPEMKIVNDEEFSESLLEEYEDELYFKMVHYPKNTEKNKYELPGHIIFIDASIEDFANHINSSYERESVTTQELYVYRERPVYDEKLWICLYDADKKQIVATGIAEYDVLVKEGSLEWIQVSKDYRNHGFGSVIVHELLNRLKGKAEFVTVSGKVDNETKPGLLYKKCGFEDETIWHVLRRKT
ncbi:MAG: GNAT family N-acetyltransferase [Saccharofermentanales bacterium]|jgi:GNAT superfamily N-acetyltransferase